jgi:hypothetical protein
MRQRLAFLHGAKVVVPNPKHRSCRYKREAAPGIARIVSVLPAGAA